MVGQASELDADLDAVCRDVDSVEEMLRRGVGSPLKLGLRSPLMAAVARLSFGRAPAELERGRFAAAADADEVPSSDVQHE